MSGISVLSAMMHIIAIVMFVLSTFSVIPMNTGNLIGMCFFLAGVTLFVMSREKKNTGQVLSD